MIIKTNILQDNYEELTTELISLEYRINESVSIPLENIITFVIDDYIKQTNQLNLYLYELNLMITNLMITKNVNIKFSYSNTIWNLKGKIKNKLNQLEHLFLEYKLQKVKIRDLRVCSDDWLNGIARKRLW
jgi:hypothetical protein